MQKFKTMTASLLAVAALASAMPASANSYSDIKTKKVSFDNLDLATAKGQEHLQRRVNYAVRVVCDYHSARTLSQIADARACMAAAQTKADGAVQVAIANYGQTRQLAARQIVVGN